MTKKILIHCSTNAGTSNFGDIIFAEMILKHLQNAGYDAGFFDLSEYVDNYLYNLKKLKRQTVTMEEADVALYFAGGYFGEKRNERIDRSIRHYKRFMHFGELALKANKPIAVIGIGAGPHLWLPSKYVVKRVCNKAGVITTRDAESTAYLEKIGVHNHIETCSDIAQTYSFPSDYHLISDFNTNNYDYIFLHTNYQVDVATLFASGVCSFVKSNPNAKVIIGADNVVNIDEAVDAAKEILGDGRVVQYDYSTPDDLCAVLSNCKMIITYKLHVGILASTLGRSVISVSKHPKIIRYYKQIGQEERCVEFSGCNAEIISELVHRYYGTEINLPLCVLKNAYCNWDLLDNYLSSL